MKEFKFNGEWEFEYLLPALEFHQFRQGYYTGKSEIKSNYNVKIIFNNELDDSIEPSIEQLSALNYLINNQNEIIRNLDKELWDNWDKISEIYELEEYDDFPKIESIDQLKGIYGIGCIFISTLHKDGFSYIEFEGGCEWDEEHGIGFTIHKNKVVGFGQALSTSFCEINHSDNKYAGPPESLKIYKAHPIFNTFKPTHQEANKLYGHKLIRKGLNNKFKEYIEKGNNINYIDDVYFSKKSYLQSAIEYDNNEIFDYLILNKATTIGALACAKKLKDKRKIKSLVRVGAEVDSDNFRINKGLKYFVFFSIVIILILYLLDKYVF